MHPNQPGLGELLQLAHHVGARHLARDLVRAAHLQLLKDGLHLGVLQGKDAVAAVIAPT